MKKKIFYVLMIACIGMTAIINTSCSNETDLVANGQQEKAGPKGVLISFGLSAKDYGADNEAATRGVSDAQTGRVIATSTSNLGNGLEVLTEVVEDNAPKTRAESKPKPALDQYYHIFAYKDGEKKAEWYGKSKDGKFSNESQNPNVQYLEPGKYKFYVFNHTHMPIKGGKFTTNIGIGSRNAFYVEEEKKIPNKKEYKLDFVLKPMFARVRTKLKVYVKDGLHGTFKGTSIYKKGTPYEKRIDPKTGKVEYTPAQGEGRFNYDSFDNNIQTQTVTDGENNKITSYSIITPELSGNFFLDGTNLSDVSFEIPAGTVATIFGKPAAGTKMLTKLKKEEDVKLEAGKSYTLVYTMYKLGRYLFSDGTVTSLAEGKSAKKTPVGFVVDEKKRIAIALKNVEGKKKWATSTSQKATTLWPKTEQGLRDGITEYNGGNVERGGYKETWVKTVDQKVRAENKYFPAFNAIKDLPQVNGKNWYVPGVGDWALALKLFGIDDPAAGYTPEKQPKNPWSKATTQGFGYEYQNIVFNQAGGTPLNSWYWTANQWDAHNGQTAITLTTNTDGACFGGAKLDTPALVRPFINY